MDNFPTVVLTDHPWADLAIEREILGSAGFGLIEGPMIAGDAAAVERMVRAADPAAILTCWAPVSAEAITAAARLAIVARMGVGLDNIDVATATARGAWVSNVPDYCVDEVSDHALGLMLSFERGITLLDRTIRGTGWHPPDFVPRRLSTLTVGIIGFGRIGSATGRKLAALGCRVLAVDAKQQSAQQGVQFTSLEVLQATADVIILHAPLTEATRHMVDTRFVAACRARPLIVNVSRGGLVDNAALIDGLQRGVLRGAALDVIDGEPEVPIALLARSDVIVTPHVAYLSDSSLADLRRSACEDVVRVLQGDEPRHPCNKPRRSDVDLNAVALFGGVSSDTRVIAGPDGPLVVKTALPKLKVAADWRSNPERSDTEVRAIKAAAGLLGASAVPDIVWVRPEEHSFAMRRVDPRLRNWKQDLLRGHIDLATAGRVGELLAQLHVRAAQTAGLAEAFADRTYFEELRLVPFFERTARRLPHLADRIRGVAAALDANRVTLVHGDFSPKNILADGKDVVLLDFEVAHWGDPRFDLGFCASHLLLKRERSGAKREDVSRALDAVLAAYAAAHGPAVDDAGLVALTGCLILARTDGDSPVDYLAAPETALARMLGEHMLTSTANSIRNALVSEGVA